ncbi:MAG: hypothetical protein GWO24_28755, partial [Akkermansiaceae bacterium]|nr:hypothetical protein [Akkermansiaceae bacterium]
VTLEFESAPGRIVGHYTTLPVLDDVEFEWQLSEDLETWTSASPVTESSMINATAAYLVDVRAEFDVTGLDHAYFRLAAHLKTEP